MGRHWKAEEIEYLRANYHRVSAYSIAEHLDRTITSVRNKAKSTGIAGGHEEHRKPIIDNPAFLCKLSDQCKTCRFCSQNWNAAPTCDYLIITGKARGGTVETCTKYKKQVGQHRRRIGLLLSDH